MKGSTHAGTPRLFRLFAEDGAFARRDGATARIYAPRKGVTVQIGAVPVAELEALVREGLVGQALGTARGRLVLTREGRAHLLRQAAPQEWRFRAQHGALAATLREGEPPLVVETAESPLLWLYRRSGRNGWPWLGEAEFAAGERLRADLTFAAMLPRITASWSAVASSPGPGAGLSPGEAMLAARQRVNRALEAVGADLSGLLVDVCGFLKGLDLVEKERGWPARSAKVVLRIGLNRLAAHYGYRDAAVGPPATGRRHMWGDEGFRPAFPGRQDQPSA